MKELPHKFVYTSVPKMQILKGHRKIHREVSHFYYYRHLFLVKSTTRKLTVRYDLIPHLLRQNDKKYLLICGHY